jgi:hypothetical protein
MLVGLAGPTFYLEPGDIYDCDDGEGTRLCSARYAIPYTSPEIERAVVAPIVEARNPLDHDGVGRRGGSHKGASSTRAKGGLKK